MTRNQWHSRTQDGVYTLARHWPPRFDLAVTSPFPEVRPDRLARQVRQDLWRLVQGLRGFSPVIQIAPAPHGLTLIAGGRVLPPVAANLADRIQTLLDSPAHRARWLVWAQERAA